MGKRRAERPARRWLGLPPPYVAAAAVLLVLVAVAGAVWSGPERPAASPETADAGTSAAGTRSAGAKPAESELDLSDLPIPRRAFCAAVDDELVPVALGAPVEERDEYEPGERVQVAPGVRDVADEHGCTFRGTGAEARVWVFASAVPRGQAAAMTREARAAAGCAPVPGRTTYGVPGLTRLCRDGDEVEASLRGLFGDAWLTCQVRQWASGGEQPNPVDVRSRAEQWCVHVATTLGANP